MDQEYHRCYVDLNPQDVFQANILVFVSLFPQQLCPCLLHLYPCLMVFSLQQAGYQGHCHSDQVCHSLYQKNRKFVYFQDLYHLIDH